MHNAKTQQVDVVIIGAGAAGIAAGRELGRRGLSCRLLEAQGRPGGRAWTDHDSLGLPLDRGCAWLHQGSINPLRPLADAEGIGYGGNMPTYYHLGGTLASAERRRQIDEFLGEQLLAVHRAGAAGRDVAASELIVADHPWLPLLDYLLTAINGVEAARYSSGEAGAEVELNENWIVREGLGTLIGERLARELPISLNCPVRRIRQQRDGVEVSSDQGSLRAAAAIVTVSTGVLGAGAIAFDPPLPAERLRALEAVPMGHAEKIALRFADDCFGLPENSFLQVAQGERVFGFHLRPFGRPVAVGYAGGALGREIAAMDAATAEAFALEFLDHAFGSRVRLGLQRSTHTGWTHDPWTQGSYSAALPGAHARRAELARPLGRLHFAGEATSIESFATAHGAWESGRRAAAAVAAALGDARLPLHRG